MRFCVVAGMMISFAGSVSAAEFIPGHWKLTYHTAAGEDTVDFISKIEEKGKAWSISLVAPNPKNGISEIKSVAIDGGQVRIVIDKTGTDYIFEGVLTGTKTILGSYGAADRLRPAHLLWTEESKLDGANLTVKHKPPPNLEKFDQLRNAVVALRRKLVKAGDDADKVQADLTAKQHELMAEQPKLLRAAFEQADDPAEKMDVVLNLLRGITTSRPTTDETKRWTTDGLKTAEKFGPRYYKEMLLQFGELLAQEPSVAAVALDVARRAEKELTGDPSPTRRVRYLNVQAAALRRIGEAKQAAAVEAELEAAESALDMVFLAKLPKVEVKPFAGRAKPNKRVVLMELFTGTECPPCAAADYGFDLLQDAYQPTELVQLQYHLHIPSPDPLTTPNNEARWAYYSKAFPEKVLGTPTPVFNGEPQLDDGGSLAMTGDRLRGYRATIDRQLEESEAATIALRVDRRRDRIAIQVRVSDLKSPEKARLRLAVVESNVRFQGANGFRYHHNVVRAMPGGADGVPIAAEPAFELNLNDLRTGLNKYLDDFARDRLAFPKPQRPLDFRKLKVIAFVQDDATHAILQAAQADVPDAG